MSSILTWPIVVRIVGWTKRIFSIAKRVATLEARITELELRLDRQPADACPYCGERAMRMS